MLFDNFIRNKLRPYINTIPHEEKMIDSKYASVYLRIGEKNSKSLIRALMR